MMEEGRFFQGREPLSRLRLCSWLRCIDGNGRRRKHEIRYAPSIDSTGNLVVAFDEGGLKRFDGVDYRLHATRARGGQPRRSNSTQMSRPSRRCHLTREGA
jgi:hypothetical protein